MFYVANSEEVFRLVCLACQARLHEFTVSDNIYKIKGRVITHEGVCGLNIVLTKVDEDTCCVEFRRSSGDSWLFYNVVKQLKEKIISSQGVYPPNKVKKD